MLKEQWSRDVEWTVVFLLVFLCHCLRLRGAVANSEGRRMRLDACFLQCLQQARCSEPTAIQPTRGVLKLAPALFSTGWTILARTFWGCVKYTARDNTTTPAFLLPTPPALPSTSQNSRMTQTICILDVQCFAQLPASQPLPFCHVTSVKLGTKGILRTYRVVAPSSLHRSWMVARLLCVGTNRWSQLPLGLWWSVVPLGYCGTSSWDAVLCGGSRARRSNRGLSSE